MASDSSFAAGVFGCDRSSVSSDSGLGVETSLSEVNVTGANETTLAIKTCLKSKLSVSAESINLSDNLKSESYKKMRLNGGIAKIVNKAQSLPASAASTALLQSQSQSNDSMPISELPKRTCLKRARFSEDDDDCFSSSIIVTQQQQQQQQQQQSSDVVTKKQRNVHFRSVTVYYFPRVQGFTCVPSQGGSTLGMGPKHFQSKQFTIDEHIAEQKRRRLKLHNKQTNTNCSEADYEKLASIRNYYLQPVPLKTRRKMLRLAGVKHIENAESISCRMIRKSREVCGCSCKVYCDPDTCSCSQAGIKCQVDRSSFPCGCVRDHCANSNGRIEFNPFRVKTHYIHAMMRLKLETNAQQHQDEQQQQQNQSWFFNGNPFRSCSTTTMTTSSSPKSSLSSTLDSFVATSSTSPSTTANHNQNHHHNVQSTIHHDPFNDNPFEASTAQLDFYSARDYFSMGAFNEMPITTCSNDTFSFSQINSSCSYSKTTTSAASSASSSPSSASSLSSSSSSSSTTTNRQQQPYLTSNNFLHNLSFYDFQNYPYSSMGCFEPDLDYNQIIENGYQSLMLNQNNENGCSNNGNVNCLDSVDPLSTLAQISSDLNLKLNGGSSSSSSSSSSSASSTASSNNSNGVSHTSNTSSNNDVLNFINQTAADLFDQENFGEIIKKSMVETVSA